MSLVALIGRADGKRADGCQRRIANEIRRVEEIFTLGVIFESRLRIREEVLRTGKQLVKMFVGCEAEVGQNQNAADRNSVSVISQIVPQQPRNSR